MTLTGSGAFGQFNFVIDVGTSSSQAGFQEVSGLTAGATKQILLKRGAFRLQAFQDWLRMVRAGNYDRTFTVRLQSGVIGGYRTWKIIGARPVKYTSAALDGSGGADVAMEELVLGYERIESA
jgi:hypothetical protein